MKFRISKINLEISKINKKLLLESIVIVYSYKIERHQIQVGDFKVNPPNKFT